MSPSVRHLSPKLPAPRDLDGRVKIALLLAYSIALFAVQGFGGLGAATLLLGAVVARGGVPWGHLARAVLPAYGIAAFLLLYNGVAASWTTGLLVAGRVLLLVYASIAMVSLSTPTELTAAIQRLLAPLGRCGVPVRDIATALSIALRFMPVTARELADVRVAQAARGAAFEQGSLGARAKAWAGLMVPLFVGLFRRADRLACAMDARCFGAKPQATSLDERRFGLGDGAVLVVGIALALGVALIP